MRCRPFSRCWRGCWRSVVDALDAGLRGLRRTAGGTARGALHARQRLFRHPRRGQQRRGRRRALPGDLPRRRLQPAADRDRRPNGRERGPGEPAELVAVVLPHRGRPLVRLQGHGAARVPPVARPAARPAVALVRARGRRRAAYPGERASPRAHRRAAPRRARGHGARRQLVRQPRGAQRARRPRHQRRRRTLPRPGQPAPRAGRRGSARCRDDLPGGADPPVAARDRRGRAHPDLRWGRRAHRRGGGRGARPWPGGAAVQPRDRGRAQRARGEDGGPVHQPRSRHLGMPARGLQDDPPRAIVRRAVREPCIPLGAAVATLPPRHRDPGRRAGAQRDDPATAHLPPAADELAQHHGPRRRRAGPRLARRGVPGPRVLGRVVHLPAAQLAHSGDHAGAADVPLSPARRGARQRQAGRPARRDVPVAERQ